MVSRELIAAVLGVGFGLALVAFPQALIRSWTAGRGIPQNDTPYGEDPEMGEKWQHVVRGVGVLVILIGLYFGYTVIA